MEICMASIDEFLARKRAKGVRLWIEDGQLRYRAPKGGLSPAEMSEIRARKAELIIRLQEVRSAEDLPPLIAQARNGQILPFSFGQLRMWSQRHPGTTVLPCALFGFFSICLNGPLDIDILKQCFDVLVQRHEALRTSVQMIGGCPMQEIHEPTSFEPRLVDLSRLAKADEADLQLQIEEMLRSPLDCLTDGVFSACVFKLSGQNHVIVVRMHHLFADPWSLALLRRELAALYLAFASGRPLPLEASTLQFADYVLWKRKSYDAIKGLHLPYWKAHLAGAVPLVLQDGQRAPTASRLEGRTRFFSLSHENLAPVYQLGQREGATHFMVLFAAFQMVLSCWSGQHDIVVGVVGTRAMTELRNVVGFCANYAPVRTDLSGDPRFRDVLFRVKETSLEANEYYYPHLENLPEILEMAEPFCRIQFHFNPAVLWSVWEENSDGFGRGLEERTFPADPGQYVLYEDLVFTLVEEGTAVNGTVLYRPDMFDDVRVDRFVKDYRRCLEWIAADPNQPLSELAGQMQESYAGSRSAGTSGAQHELDQPAWASGLSMTTPAEE
jgi:Condensation domain/TubC N-terminal docking domain